MTDRIVGVAFAVAVVIVVVVFGFAAFNLVSSLGDQQERFDSFRQNCAEAGGHIYMVDVAFCVTDDGRFVEVYP